MVYLDYAASTPLAEEVAVAMEEALHNFGNPSSLHSAGWEARKKLEEAREQIAATISAEASEIVFTSGGTESNHLALLGIARACGKRKILLSSIEHKSLLKPAELLKREGFQVEILPVTAEGLLNVEALNSALDESVGLVSVMWVNNELGTIQPIFEIAALCKERGVLFHSDASQAFLTEKVCAEAVDALTLSAHKIYGPKGIGALFLRSGTPCAPLLAGGGQEQELRAGAQNVPGAVGFGVAASLAFAKRLTRRGHFSCLRQHLAKELERVPVERTVKRAPVAPHFFHLLLPEEAQSLVIRLDLEGFCLSSGSACASSAPEPSHVLQALGKLREEAKRALRVSFGEGTTKEELSQFAGVLRDLLISKAYAHSAP